jgi:hypothetical protein
LSREELAKLAGKYERLFGAAFQALLRISSGDFDRRAARQTALDTIAIINRYTNDE